MRPDIAAFLGALIGGGLSVLVQLYIAKKNRFDRLNLARAERLDKYKMVALEKRLDAHQTAFRLWYDLMWSLNDDAKRGDQAKKCEEWWVDNHFYLDKKSNDAFKDAATVAITFGQYRADNEEDAANRKNAFREMHKVGNYLREGVGLPHLENQNDWERKILGTD